MKDPAAPRALYRVQLNAGFDFDRAAALADYLAALGVSHLYASPCLQAAAGSTHGYDVVDPTRVSAELGGEEAHGRLVRALAEAQLGQVLDVVPNHLAVSQENPWWWDVLENGQSSVYAPFFDIDWDPPESRFKGVILLPVLADHYGRVLERGELRIERVGSSFRVCCGDQRWPLSPESVGTLLEATAATFVSAELAAVATGLRELPVSTDAQFRIRRGRQLDSLLHTLEWTLDEDATTAAVVDQAIERISGDPDELDRVLEAQHYRLAHWRAGMRDLDYRRFFDVDSLVGVRVEDPNVFSATHALVLDWLRDDVLDGVRIDHPDGLRRPRAYLETLRSEAPGAWIVVEKILGPDEELPAGWPVDGTTGYEFIARVGGLFVDPAGEEPLTALYRELTGEPVDWAAIVYARRHQVVREVLWSDLTRLAHWGVRVCEGRRRYRDFSSWEVREALAEVLACFPVYRSYVTEEGDASEEDRERIEHALAEARQRRPDVGTELFDLIEAVLAGGADGRAERELRMRFQQLTGPVMAKAVEDTAFYTFARFVALNEVGGAPDRFGVSPARFHEHCRATAERWPRTVLALSTHDTKRSEDVRARLALLSEIPDEWGTAARRWSALNARHRKDVGLPEANLEYLFYQTLVGAWPLSVERALAYMIKAAREAKTRTSWTAPAEEYEAALEAFVRGALADPAFIADLERFVEPLVGPGRVNSLAQKLIQLTAPGVPDVYQGTELWDLSLVDPDNRRPVDWELRRRLLDELRAAECAGPDAAARAMVARVDEGGSKLWVVRQALRVRCRHTAAFGAGGSYEALTARGPAADHAVAFARAGEVVTVVPRLVLGLARRGGWGDTELELRPGQWRDVMTGRPAAGRARLADLLADFPVALLERTE